jgi:hypothetical protein
MFSPGTLLLTEGREKSVSTAELERHHTVEEMEEVVAKTMRNNIIANCY